MSGVAGRDGSRYGRDVVAASRLLRLFRGRCEDRDYGAADNSLRRPLSASLICILRVQSA